jgi:hypothetical protein
VTTSPTLLSRLTDDPLLGGLAVGAWWVWWRGLTPWGVARSRALLQRVASGEALDDEALEQWRDVLASCVVAVAPPHEEPVRVKLTRLPALVNLDQQPAWVPYSILEGWDAPLTVALVANLAERATLAEACRSLQPPPPPKAAKVVPSSAGLLAVEPLAYRLASPDLQARGLAVAMADYLRPDREAPDPERVDLERLGMDLGSAKVWRWLEGQWVPLTLAPTPTADGHVWVGRLLQEELVELWLGMMAPCLEAADWVRGYLTDAASVRRLSATGEAPWTDDPDWCEVSPVARVWARAAWAYAWRREVPASLAG